LKIKNHILRNNGRSGIDEENVTRIINLQRVMTSDYFFELLEKFDRKIITIDAERFGHLQ
jgi:hypothetical protein